MRVSSTTPTTETSEEDFSIMIASLTSAGSVSRKAIGSRMRRKVWKRRHAAHVGRLDEAARHAGETAAHDLGLIGGGAQRHAGDGRDHARHVEADGRQQVVDQQQLHQQRHAAEEADEEAPAAGTATDWATASRRPPACR